MNIEVTTLPYAVDALSPHIGTRTVRIHYEKHHKGYASKLEKQLAGTAQAEMSLEELIRTAVGDTFNDAAQVWNHNFYWRGLKPGGGGRPVGALLDALNDAFGSYAAFIGELAEAANGEFGSGWAWLVADRDRRLRVQKSSDAENPMRRGYRPLLTIDVWEHAYYLDYQNRRDRYVEAIIDHLIDWDFVAKNLRQDAEATPRRTGKTRRRGG